MSPDFAERIAAARQKMDELQLSALLITRIENVGWITGFTGSNGFVLLTQDIAIFATDSRYLERAKTECAGFEVILLATSAPEEIVEVLGRAEQQKIGFEADHLTFRLHAIYCEKLPKGVELVSTERLLDDLRMVKDAFEISQIEAACVIADRTFQYILPYLKPGAAEYDIMLELEWYIRKQCRAAIAFDTAVASGPNGAFPHSRPGERKLEAGDFITLDFGAKVNGYCSDITRTVVMGPPNDEQEMVYQTVLDAQSRAIDAITAGASGKAVDAVARDYIASAGYKEYFGHGLGHSIGRTVHDGPGFSIRSEVTLMPNMVFTVEPGIYRPGWGGVRIEDDVVVTNGRARYLTHSPRQLVSL